jgi:hypothetical protein
VSLVLALSLSFTFLAVNATAVLDFFSYIWVTSAGIEQRRAPLKHIKYTWTEMDKLGKLYAVIDVNLIKSSAKKWLIAKHTNIS